MARKRRITTPWGLSEIPVTPVNRIDGHITNLRDFQKQYDAEEKAKAEAPIRKIENDFKVELAQHAAKLTRFWSQPLSVIADVGVELCPNDIAGDYSSQEGSRNTKADVAVYAAFKEYLASRGCTLSDAGWNRLGSYLQSLVYSRNIALTQDSWTIALDRLNSLGVFPPGELSGYDNAVAAQEAQRPKPTKPEPSFDELLESVSGESREGRKKLVEATQDAVYASASPLFAEWLSHLSSQFGGFVPTEQDRRYILNEWIPRNNLSYNQADTYNKARRAMVSLRRWPDSLLTADEQLAREVEDSPLNDYHRRREMVRRVRDFRG